jgi:UDP-glucose 4-epimerase
MRAIVTGGAGFIGSHVAEALAARGDEVHVLDNLSSGKPENVPAGAQLHEADIRDPGSVFGAVRPELVFHLAAQASVSVSVAQPGLDADVNVLGTVAVLEAARAHGAQVVFSSTGGAIYGECESPATEQWERRPLSPYGTSKLAGEEYLGSWNRLHGTHHVALRYGNVYGPRQDPHGEAGVVAIFLRAVADGRRPTIFGDGSQERDYVYVGDVARATLAATTLDGGVLNIATGEPISVLQLVDAMRRATGREIDPELGPERLGDLQRSVLDPGLAGRELGWQPEVSLEDGLRAAWQFFSTASG